MSLIKDKAVKSILAIFALVLLIVACIITTTSIRPKASGPNEDFSVSAMSEAGTIYFNWAKDRGGAYILNITPGRAAGFVGYQSKADDKKASFKYGANNTVNGVVYSFEGLTHALITTTEDTSQPYVETALKSSTSSSGATKTPGTETHEFAEYIGYGYLLSELGFDQVGTRGGALRMVSGVIMLAVYVLSTALNQFIAAVVEILKWLNPFKIITGFVASDKPSGMDSNFAEGMKLIANIVAKYYDAFSNFSLGLIIPFILVIAITRWILTDKPGTFWPYMKNFFIRLLFVAVGVPVLCSIYDAILGSISDDTNIQSSNYIIESTFLDFEDWANVHSIDATQVSAGGTLSVINGTDTSNGANFAPNDAAIINARDMCYSINSNKKKLPRTLDDTPTAVDVTDYEYLAFAKPAGNGTWDESKTIDVLMRYAKGDVVSAAEYASKIQDGLSDVVFQTSRTKECFDTYLITSYLDSSQGNGSGVNEDDAKKIAKGRWTAGGADAIWSTHSNGKSIVNPWITTKASKELVLDTNSYSGGLTDMGMYNYLNTEFTKGGAIVYSPDTTSDDNIKRSHYSVNLVGKGMMQLLYFLDAIILMGCITVIGYLYGGAMIIGNFKAMFQAVPQVFSGLLGSMRGIGMSIALLFAALANVILTFLMFDIAKQVYKIIHFLILLPISTIIDNGVAGKIGGIGIAGTLLYMLSMIINMLVLCTVTQKLLIYRTAVCQSAAQGLTELVSKLVGVTLTAPNIQSNNNGLNALAAGAAGLGMAAASGKLDGLDSERMGLGSSDMLTDGSVSDTIGDENKTNAFGVVGGENGLNGEGLENVNGEDSGLSADRDGNLYGEDGMPLTDSDGNQLSMDENGNLLNADGTPLTDENGDPIKADGAHLDENGNLVDADGNPIKDSTGGDINSNDVMGTNEDGEVVDAKGDNITDNEGNPYHVDENGNVVDENGNPLKDSHGNNLKVDPKTGKIVDGQGHAVKADGKGNFKDGNGRSVKNADGSNVNGNPTAQAHANGNLTDTEGNVLTDANGDPLRIDDDPDSPTYGQIVDGQGNIVTDSKGNPLRTTMNGSVVDGEGNAVRADENGVMTDSNGEPIMAAQTDENGEVVMGEDGEPVSAGNGDITNTGNYDGPNTANMDRRGTAAYQANARERAMNADKQAEQYLAGKGAVAGAAGAVEFNKGSTNGSGGKSGAATVYGTGRKAGNGGSVLGNAGANVNGEAGHTDAGLMLANGSQINDVAMPEGSKAGVVTSQGFMSQAEAQSKGLDGVSAIQTADGNIVYGVPTDGNDFVPGIQTNDGFIPGVTNNGTFVPGGFDSNGNFHAGVYTNNGFTEGTFQNGSFVSGRTMPDGTVEAGQYTSSGFQRADGSMDTTAVAPDMGNAAVGGSVVSNAVGANVIDNNGGYAGVYANTNGGLAIGSANGGKVAVQQNSSTGAMAYKTADGKQLDIKSGSFDQMQVGGVDASAANGGIVLNDGAGGSVPIVPNSVGAASISDGKGGRIGLTATSSGNTALSTGDGNAIGMFTAEDGSMKLQTRGGQGVNCVALDNGGVGIVDSAGNVAPVVTTDNGHLALQNGNDFVPITADKNGNMMIGNNKPNGTGAGLSSTYVVPVVGGGFGINNKGVHYQTSNGFAPLAPNDADGIVEIVSAGGNGGQLQFKSDSGQNVAISSSGAGSVRVAGNNKRSSTITTVDDSMIVDGGASGATGAPVVHGTYHRATSNDVSAHAAASNAAYVGSTGGGYNVAPSAPGEFTRGSTVNNASAGPSAGSRPASGGVHYNGTYDAGSDIVGNGNLGGFTVETIQSGGNGGGSGRRHGSSGVNTRQVKISNNAAANNDYNVVMQIIKDNPMAAAMVVSGIANKNVGTVAMGAAMGYSTYSGGGSGSQTVVRSGGGSAPRSGGSSGRIGRNNDGQRVTVRERTPEGKYVNVEYMDTLADRVRAGSTSYDGSASMTVTEGSSPQGRYNARPSTSYGSRSSGSRANVPAGTNSRRNANPNNFYNYSAKTLDGNERVNTNDEAGMNISNSDN